MKAMPSLSYSRYSSNVTDDLYIMWMVVTPARVILPIPFANKGFVSLQTIRPSTEEGQDSPWTGGSRRWPLGLRSA